MNAQNIAILELRRELIQTQQMVLGYQLRDVVAELEKARAAPTEQPAAEPPP